jgi:phosphotransferase system HPr-like phosphotransfer protein
MFRTFSIIGSFLGLFLLATSASLAAPAAGPAPAETGAPLKSTVSGAEMLEQGREYRAQIESTALQIQAQVLQAKSDKDVIRLNCLIDKQTQVKVNGNIMDQALQSLQETVSRHDEGAQLHEYTRITIVNQKVQVLRTEADACVGAETNYVGRTKVVVEVPPGLQNNVDQPTPSEPPVSVVDRPPPASPF